MGVEKIVLVNDIHWLGGQFSAEGLGAIDENRGHGYDGTVPIPRSGLFREIIDAIESKNAELYGGVKRPGNTRVITTARPVVSEQVFRELLAPFEQTGQVKRFSNLEVQSARLEGNQLRAVVFATPGSPESTLTVTTKMTIDATDWGDVIKAAGGEYDFGIDGKGEFGEPSAPMSHQPETDMNPITWCAVLEQRPGPIDVIEPAGFDARNFQGKWGWIEEEFAYTTRRLVDGAGFDVIDHPDIVLINNPNVDYPLDRYPASVAEALEASQPGASAKNIVQLAPDQRHIVFDDAKQRTLQYLHYLRSNFSRFRSMDLSDEFETDDKLPPKPYIRESLRLVAKHIIVEQEVLGFGSRSHYARAMYPDAVFSWQFELDFHPTARKWLGDEAEDGPWEADFRGNRRFGRGGTGRAMFPVRSLVPVRIKGLLGGQKNLGYSSIVGSSCRLHDQSVAVGQAAGAVAAISLQRGIDPARICFDQASIFAIWDALLGGPGAGVAIWPFADVDPYDDGFQAIQQLALRRLLPLEAGDVSFRADDVATEPWLAAVVAKIRGAGLTCELVSAPATRRDAARMLWKQVASQTQPPRIWRAAGDADDDGLPDSRDPLPFTKGTASWQQLTTWDGVPDEQWDQGDEGVQAFNFTSAEGPIVEGFVSDHGKQYSAESKFGWSRDLTNNTRLRKVASGAIRDGFVFTRTQDTWECDLASGTYTVTVCIGDAGHDQPGQYVSVEGKTMAADVTTQLGSFRELTSTVDVDDGRLTVVMGKPDGGSNTTLNWILIRPSE